MLASENDEDKIRKGKWKHFVTARSFSGLTCYMQGQNMLTLGIASAEPPVMAPPCASCFTAAFPQLNGQEPT